MYKIYLYFVATADPLVNIERVSNRTEKGGHSVPKEKIMSRYYRTLDNLYDAFSNSERVFLFDNSDNQLSGTFDFFTEKKNNKLFMSSLEIFNWFDKYLLNKI